MKKLATILIACLLLTTFDSQTFAQGKDLRKVFAPVKKELRTKLIERLQLFILLDIGARKSGINLMIYCLVT
jgi:hypothetical protein